MRSKAVFTRLQTEAAGLLSSFLEQFPMLSAEQKAQLSEKLCIKVLPKNTVLWEAGMPCSSCYLVLKGLLREYVLHDGLEKNIAFYEEYAAAAQFAASPNEQLLSASFLVCAEPSVLIYGNINAQESFFHEIPALEKITREKMEQDFGKAQQHAKLFLAANPEERYLYLIQHKPSLLQRVPQNQLASYIGITPESLSRIRKRLAQAPVKK